MRWAEYSAAYDERVRKVRRHATWAGEFYNRFVTKWLTFLLYQVGCTANGATVLSLVCVGAAMAVIIAAPANWNAGLASLLLLQLSAVMDIVDGQLARIRQSASRTGAFLDLVIDRLSIFSVYVGFGWAIHLTRGLSPGETVVYAAAALGYIYYSELGFIREQAFPEQRGTMQRFGGGWLMEVIKLPYQCIHLNVALLWMSLGYLAGLGFEAIVAYGLFAWLMCAAQITFAFVAASRSRSEAQ